MAELNIARRISFRPSARQSGYAVLGFSLLSAWFFYRHYVPQSTDTKVWVPVAGSLTLPAAAKVPAELLTAFEDTDAKGVDAGQQALIARGDGAVLADYFVRLYGIYHKDRQLYAVLSFSSKNSPAELKHLPQGGEFSGLQLEKLSAREAVLVAGSQQIKLTLFRGQPAAAAPGEKS